ncbi:MAG: ThiF family adenylyltransferase [Candidatus Hodarchaeales archaeon]
MSQLNNTQHEIYSRQLVLPFFGEKGQLNLQKAKIAICGVGGLGAHSALSLAKMGAGYLRLIDRDLVELSNLPRTPLYSSSDVDIPKVEAAKKMILKLTPDIEIDARATNIDIKTVDDLLNGIDFVVDGLDSFKPRYAINHKCMEKKITYFFAGALTYSANISTFTYRGDDQPCLACIFPGIEDVNLPTCEIAGIHPSILSISTGIQVAEITRVTSGRSPLLEGKMLFYDLSTLSQDIITFKKNPKCLTCSDKAETLSKIESEQPIVTELCGNNSYMIVPSKREGNIAIEETGREFRKASIPVLKQSLLGLTARIVDLDLTVSIFRGGNILVRGASSNDDALVAYSKISPLLVSKKS